MPDRPPSVTLLTNEYPPNVYGGAGIHVQYLAAALAGLTRVEVRSFGRDEPDGPVTAEAFAPDPSWLARAEPHRVKVLAPIATDLLMITPEITTEIIHCHTW